MLLGVFWNQQHASVYKISIHASNDRQKALKPLGFLLNCKNLVGLA